MARLRPDDSGGALCDCDVVPVAREGACARVARVGARRSHHAEWCRRVARGASLQFAAVEIVGWIRRSDQLGGLAALPVYLVLMGGAWLVVSMQLPHRNAAGPRSPRSVLFGVGLLFVNVFNVYVTTRLVEGRADTYGALGIAAALLFSLVLVGRVMIVSAELNASLDERRQRRIKSTTR